MTLPSDLRGVDERRSRLPDWAWDLIAILVVLSSLILPGPRPPMQHPAVPTALILLTCFAALLLPLRRYWPVSVLTACLIVYSGTVIMGFAAMGVGIATIICGFGMANRTSRTTAYLTGGIASIIVVILSLTVANLGVVDPQVFQIAAGIAVATAMGDSTRSRREYVRAVTERAERAEQTREAEAHRRVAEERLRIAQDLHDTVAHQISVISLNAGVASGAINDRPDRAREALGTIRMASREVLTEISELLRYLRSDEAREEVPAPQVGLAQIHTLISRISESGLDVTCDQVGDLGQVTGAVDAVAYRIIQEGLTNAHKHGSEHRAHLTISVEAGALTITITNPVSHNAAANPVPGDRLGLVGVRERVASVGGQVSAGPIGDHFRLHAQLPLHTPAPETGEY